VTSKLLLHLLYKAAVAKYKRALPQQQTGCMDMLKQSPSLLGKNTIGKFNNVMHKIKTSRLDVTSFCFSETYTKMCGRASENMSDKKVQKMPYISDKPN
jgi:hypothetical protein